MGFRKYSQLGAVLPRGSLPLPTVRLSPRRAPIRGVVPTRGPAPRPRSGPPPLRSAAALLAAALLLLAGCGGAHRRPANVGSPANRGGGSFAGAVFPPAVRAPSFALTDQDGRTVSPASVRGHVAVLAFVWSGSPSATLAAQQVRGALDEVGASAPRAQALLIASPGGGAASAAAGRRLLRAAALQDRARYLTGTAAQLRTVWRAYGVALPSAGRQAFLASPTVLLLDRAGFERVGFALEALTPEALAHDLRALLAGA
jgi:cytochrome oxidase Cu insertion factor (SCO1/SenC/PrrC family)